MNDSTDATVLGANIRAARKAKGWDQDTLARAVLEGGRSGTVSKWESGKQVPSALALHRVAVALGVSADELLGRKTSPPHQPTGRGAGGSLVANAEPIGDAERLEILRLLDAVERAVLRGPAIPPVSDATIQGDREAIQQLDGGYEQEPHAPAPATPPRQRAQGG